MRPPLLLLLAVASGCEDEWGPPPSVEPPTGLLSPGVACVDHVECQSGWCIDLAGARVCAARCAGECQGGLVCKRAVARDPSSASICVPPSSLLCGECGQDSDCGLFGDLCLQLDRGWYCGVDCSETRNCPEGYGCQSIREADGQELSRQCLPHTGTCVCSAATDGLRRACRKSVAGVGTCVGQETCLAGTGWVSCDARTPLPELCDDFDNDCDGLSDEDQRGQNLARPCGYGPEPRRPECVGAEACQAGVYGFCSVPSPPPSEYECDGRDDDCNGVTDDGVLHSPDHCAVCGDACLPDPPMPASTERSCVEQDGSYRCGAIRCRVPHFDVNGSEADGCEVEDDHRRVEQSVLLNSSWPEAFEIEGVTASCQDSEGRVSCLGCGSGEHIVADNLRLPNDARQHVPIEPTFPNVDYHRFYVDGSACSVDTWVCASFDPGSTGDESAQLELCVSNSVAGPTVPPVFSAGGCVNVRPWLNPRVELRLNNWGDEYFYIRVRSPVAGVDVPNPGPFAGAYSLAAYDGQGYCPLPN